MRWFNFDDAGHLLTVQVARPNGRNKLDPDVRARVLNVSSRRHRSLEVSRLDGPLDSQSEQ